MSDLTRRQLLGRAAIAAGSMAAITTAGTALGAGAPGRAPAGTSRPPLPSPPPDPWQMFNCGPWNDSTLFTFGSSASHAADIGEVMQLVRVVRERTGNPVNPTTGDFDILVYEWQRLAARLERRAAASLAAGNHTSARQQWLRASTYQAQALFFVLGTSRPGREQSVFKACEQDWLNAIGLWDVPVIQAAIPYQGTSMPAYFFRASADGAARPTVIICNGSDGQNVDLLAEGATAGLERGYNVLLFEAPGQMSLLFNQLQPMQANWAGIMDAVVGWLGARADVDASRIAAIGISLLGMVLTSAAAGSPGLAAAVLEPGAYSLPLVWGDKESLKAVEETQNAPAAIQAKVAREVNAGMAQAWHYMTPLERWTLSKRSELYTTNAIQSARKGQPPSDYYALVQAILQFQYQSMLPDVRIPMYVTLNQADEFFGPQAKKIPDMLTGLDANQKFLRTLTYDTGTQFHDQPLGPWASQEFIFDWLNATLGV